jgi:hypothetical protein
MHLPRQGAGYDTRGAIGDIEKDSNGDPAANNGTSGKNYRKSPEIVDGVSLFQVKVCNAFSRLRLVVPPTFFPVKKHAFNSHVQKP